MLGFYIHKLFEERLFNIDSKEIHSMKVVEISDLPYLASAPILSINTAWNFSKYKHNFSTTLYPYSSLAALYPRYGIWAYLHWLFAWGRACGVLSQVITEPDKSTIGEAFLSYICEIDHLIDSFDSKELIVNNSRSIGKYKNIMETTEKLCMLIESQNLTQSTKFAVQKLIVQFRRDALQALKKARSNEEFSLNNTLEVKYYTAGKLLWTWSRILCELYLIPAEMRDKVSDMFLHYSMAFQVIDDVADLPSDYLVKSENIALALIRQEEDEWSYISKYLDSEKPKFVSWNWLKKYTPPIHI
jgi:hypothetical protein